jgi:GlcNAc-P-P-Und epimerase
MSGESKSPADDVSFGTRRCLVTGGSGFIGTHLLEALVRDPDVERIVVLDLEPPRVHDPRIEFWFCDLRREIVADASAYADLDTCFHLAAVCKEPGFPWDEYFVVNHVGARHLCAFLDAAGISNLVFTSTIMVFRAGEQRMAEESLTAPDTAYGMSKVLAEVHLEGWAQAAPGRRLRIIRPGVVFGRGEGANFTRLYYALKRSRFAFIGRRDTIKGCIYVKDVIRVLRLLASDGLERTVYNLVYPDAMTIAQLCEAMFATFGFRRRVPTVPLWLAMAGAYVFELLSACGLRTAIHHRRVEKLYHSTNASAEPARQLGVPVFSIRDALGDWRNDCAPGDLY